MIINSLDCLKMQFYTHAAINWRDSVEEIYNEICYIYRVKMPFIVFKTHKVNILVWVQFGFFYMTKLPS